MAKTLSILGHCLTSLGVALLLLTCFLVPQHNVLGDGGGPGTTRACASPTDCNESNCVGPTCVSTACKTGQMNCKDCSCDADGDLCNCK